jgi:hypothetical protein
MRTTLVLGLLLVLIAVPAAQAQQPSAPARDAQPTSLVVEAPVSAQQVDTARVTAVVVESEEEVVDVAAREMSARSLLAIVGGVVVVVALIVLLK